MAGFSPKRWTRQPTPGAKIDWDRGLLRYDYTGLVFCPSVGGMYLNPLRTGVSPNALTPGAIPLATTVSGSPTLTPGPGGIGIKFSGTANDYVEFAPTDAVMGATNSTVIIVRSLHDASAFTTDILHGGSDNTGTHRAFIWGFPYTDSKIYWDFGPEELGTAALSWTANIVETFVFTTGTARGKEIWRNGALVANNSGMTATRTAVGGSNYRMGPCAGGTTCDREIIYLYVTLTEQLDVSRIQTISLNPWAIFAPQREFLTLPSVSTAVGPFRSRYINQAVNRAGTY